MTKKVRIYDNKAKSKVKKKAKPAKAKKKPKVKKSTEYGSGDNKGKANTSGGHKKESIIGIKKLEKSVLKYIVGQDSQVRQIITAIYRAMAFQSIKSNVLVIGNSGTGKTATIKQIAETLDIPYTIEDATKYTQEGYYGSDVTNMIYNLIQNADNDFEEASRGIIIIDEIDKKTANGAEHDVAGVEVLKSLLKIIEGTTIMIDPMDFFGDPIPFNTQNIIIIFMGAFPGLEKLRNQRLNRNAFGFAQTKPEVDGTTNYLKQDLVKYGMPEEFVGRIDTIIEMNNLGMSELVDILVHSKLSIFRKYKDELKKLGIELKYDKEIFQAIAQASLELDTGVRELSNTVNHIFEHIVYEILANPGKYTKCKLLPGIVEDNTNYKLS